MCGNLTNQCRFSLLEGEEVGDFGGGDSDRFPEVELFQRLSVTVARTHHWRRFTTKVSLAYDIADLN